MKNEKIEENKRSPYISLQNMGIDSASSMKEIKQASLRLLQQRPKREELESLDRIRMVNDRLLTDFFLYQREGNIYKSTSLQIEVRQIIAELTGE